MIIVGLTVGLTQDLLYLTPRIDVMRYQWAAGRSSGWKDRRGRRSVGCWAMVGGVSKNSAIGSGHQDGLVNQHPHEEHEGWSGHDGATDNEGKSNGRRDDEYVQVKVSEVWVLLPLYDLCDGISSLFCATLSLKSKGQKGSQLTGYAG